VQALQGVSGLLLRLKLHKSVVVLDVHAPQLAKGLKVALQVTLTCVLRVKVHHKQRGVGLDCPAPLVLPALDVTITLGPLNLEPPASVAKLFAIEAADGVIPVTFVFHEHKRKALLHVYPLYRPILVKQPLDLTCCSIILKVANKDWILWSVRHAVPLMLGQLAATNCKLPAQSALQDSCVQAIG
jgi:hypothetical protein